MNQKRTKESTEGERPAVRIVKDLDFPRSTVFEWITDPKKAAKWWGSPEGAVKVAFEWDPRPGGAFTLHDSMDGKVAKTTGTILELIVPERVVFRSMTIPPEGTAPWEALQTMTLEELGPQRTRITVHVKVLGSGSFPGGFAPLEEGYQGGWGETLEILQRELRSAQSRG